MKAIVFVSAADIILFILCSRFCAYSESGKRDKHLYSQCHQISKCILLGTKSSVFHSEYCCFQGSRSWSHPSLTKVSSCPFLAFVARLLTLRSLQLKKEEINWHLPRVECEFFLPLFEDLKALR